MTPSPDPSPPSTRARSTADSLGVHTVLFYSPQPACFCQSHGDVNPLCSWTSDEISSLLLHDVIDQDGLFLPSESDGDREHEAQSDRDSAGDIQP